MIKNNFSDFNLHDEVDINHCAEVTQGYSGADIKLLCKEIAMRPIRRIIDTLIHKETITNRTGTQSVLGILEGEDSQIKRYNIITREDVNEGILRTNHSGSRKMCERYKMWAAEFGST